MKVFNAMALGGSHKESLTKNLSSVSCTNVEYSTSGITDNIKKSEHLFTVMKKQEEFVSLNKKKSDDKLCSKINDRKFTDFVDCNASERNDDINQSSDSLSSSASISDSDLTSTDSDDSLALSESESITDVTPLNSPYCDSPLPQNRHIDFKSEDKNLSNPCRNAEYDASGDNCHRPEMNVLMKAIEKLELEAKNNSEFGFRESLMRRRAASFSNEEAKRIEQENQRLFKRVISQQNRIRAIYSTPNQPSSKSISFRHQDLVKSDGDISVCLFMVYLYISVHGAIMQIHPYV